MAQCATPEHSTFPLNLLQAQSSKAQVIGLANAGGDTIDAVKQAAEFGIVQRGQRLAGLLFSRPMFMLSDCRLLDFDHRILLGPQRQDASFCKALCRARRWQISDNGSGRSVLLVLHYLEAVAKVGSPADATKVVQAMKATSYDDPLFGHTTVRQDGRAIHAMYLVEVKKPVQSKGAYDYFKVLSTIPADKAFRPLADEKGTCSLVKTASQTGSKR